MAVKNVYKRIALKAIKIKRAERQRREIDISDIESSIQARGVIQPILVRELEADPDGFAYELIVGERRYTASLKCGYSDIPCRLVAPDTSEIELQIIELEENLKRKDLGWRDQCVAIKRIHELYVGQDPDWTQEKTARALGVTAPLISYNLTVADEIENPAIANATNLLGAYNIISRRDQRRVADAMSDILSAGIALVQTPKDVPAQSSPADAPSTPALRAPANTPVVSVRDAHASILNENFLLWAPKYTGAPFNLIHCDFPYGVNVFAGPQSGSQKWKTYDDSPDVYWALVRCLCDNLDRLMTVSGHLMFWLSADIEIMYKTIQCFREHAPSLDFWGKPLIWHKTDNAGILSDPKRGPRHVYEACIIASRDDRLIIRATSDAYGAPTNKDHHPSTKPEPVLRQFMQMFVDENTRMLDPTCGSGSSLRAAESLGARTVLGLEIDPDHCTAARSALRQFRTLRAAAASK